MAPPPLLALEKLGCDFGQPRPMAARLARTLGLSPRRKTVRAVDEVTLTVAKGEAVAIVGESGCGKSTLGRLAVGLLAPSRGRVLLDGEDVADMSRDRRLKAQLRTQMIFQNSVAALNPRDTIAQILGEPLAVHGKAKGREIRPAVLRLMARVGLAEALADRYPHQLSGGQCQRVGIARALAVEPDIIVCDEPVSALDVSIQAQILNLFQDLRDELGISYLFISHDLSVVERIADRVAVMYLGRVVEEGRAKALFARPAHPYTRALMASAPRIGGGRIKELPVVGERPSPYAPPTGCHFHPRCPLAVERCRTEAPALRPLGTGVSAACHLSGGPTAGETPDGTKESVA